tara:strand:- start:223 stop:531 length:309 start_codon:yes stop_codon:yes gene_type:complete
MSKIEDLCGVYPTGFIKEDISSDPNYVFVNDPAYSARPLYDSEGNIVFVNSFIECEHYVSGGWGYSPSENTEILLHQLLFVVVIALVIFQFLNRKFKFVNLK